MSAAVHPPVAMFDGRRALASVMSAFSPFGMAVPQPQPYVVTATTTPLLIQGLTPNGISLQPTSIAIFHPTPAISLASAPDPMSSSSSPPAAVSAFSVPPSSLSALRTRRESRPAAPLRGSAEVMCPNKQCGMRFASDESLVEHLTRVHFNNRDIKKQHPRTTIQPAVQVTYAIKRRANGTVHSQTIKGKAKQSTTAERGKSAVVKGERSRGGKRPHAATNGEKAGRRKQVNVGKQHKEQLSDDQDDDVSDEGSSLSSDSGSDMSSDDSDGSLDSDDSNSDSDDDDLSDSSSDDEDDKGGPFERFGRAIPSSSSSSSSDSNSDSSSDDSSPRRTRRSPSSRRRPVTSRPRRPSRASPFTAIDSSSSSPTSTHPTTSRDPRLERIHRLHYLYKYRQPLSTPVHLLRCALCTAGLHPNLGLLMSCHGGCGLSFHQQCIEMWTVPSGPWYCSDDCVKEECRVKEDASEDSRLDVDLKFLQLCRRWQHWYYSKKKRLNDNKPLHREPKQRFIVPLMCTVPRCPSFPSESKWADAFPPARLPAAPLVRRIFYPLSLSASPEAYVNSTSSVELIEQAAQSSAAFEQQQQQQQSVTTSTAGSATTSNNTSSSEPPRPRRPHHLMFSLKQPRSDPTDFVPTYPSRYAAKGQKQVTSSRSLRTSHSSLRSAAFLLSLRVPNRDPNIAICCVCENGDSIDDNPIILCDGPCCMAYHRHCVGLSHMPKEEDVWCCSDVCKRARSKNSAVEDDVVVRLVQRRRDEYDARGPYRGLYEEGKGGEAASAELLEQFAQLDGQYFCPRVMTRLWRKGKWRLQEVELRSMLEVMEVVGEVSGKWKVQVEEDGDSMDGKAMLVEDWVERVEESIPTDAEESKSEQVQIEETNMANDPVIASADETSTDVALSAEGAVVDSLADAMMQVDESAAAADVSNSEQSSASAPASPTAAATEPTSILFRSASTPAALLSATIPSLSDTAMVDDTNQVSLDLIQPTPLPPTTPVALLLPAALTHPPRTISEPTTTHTSDKADTTTDNVLTEEERLLAAYYTQVLANNQTKSCLLSAFTAHKLITPTSLHTLATRQQADEVTIQTYLEYEEKHAVGSEKDRVRRQQKCHVNYCRCHACFNAHLVVDEDERGEEEEEAGDELRDREVDVEETGEVMDESQLDGEEEDSVEVSRAATPIFVPATTTVSATVFTLPPSLRPLTGSIHPPVLMRFIDHCLRHRDEYLALAKRVSSADVALLLEAGGKGARTFTRQQLRAKRDEESAESSRQHTRRRGSLFHDESSPSPPPTDAAGRANTELMSLQKWGWDRTWRQRLEAGLVTDMHHATRSRGKPGMVDDAMGAIGGVMPRGHARLRILFRGKSVFTARDGEYDDNHLPVVRFKPRSQHRGAAQSLKLKFKRTGRDMTVVDGNSSTDGMRGSGRERLAVRFMLGSTVRLEVQLAGRVGKELRRLHAGWLDKRSQHWQQSTAEEVAESVSSANVSATEAMSHAAALATEMVQRLQALQQEPALTTAVEKKRIQREKEQARKTAERERKERAKLQHVQQKERARLSRSRQVNVYVQVAVDGVVVVQIGINLKFRWGPMSIGRTEIDRLNNAWPQLMTVPPLAALVEHDGSNGAATEQHFITDQGQGAAGLADGDGRPHRTRHFTRHRHSQPPTDQADAAVPNPIDALAAVATSSQHALPLAPTYSRKGRGAKVELLPRLPSPPPPPIAEPSQPVEYVLDANGLPIITDPIPDDICLGCGYGGDVLLCDGTIDGIPCVRCYHWDELDPPLAQPPEGEWRCPTHSCSTCQAEDTNRSYWPFTYCEWCDKSWCKECATDVANTGELVDWTPKAATEQARWVCCLECVRYFRRHHKMTDGDDFRVPDRQLKAHAQKVKGQLDAHKRLRKQQERERRAAEPERTKKKKGGKAQGASKSDRKRPAAQQHSKTSKRRKSEGAQMHSGEQQELNGDDQLLGIRRSGRARKRRVQQEEQEEQTLEEVRVKLEDEDGPVDAEGAEGENEQAQVADETPADGVHLNGVSPASPLDTVSDTQTPHVSPAPPPLTLQPCISRSEQSTTRRQLHPLDRTHSQTRAASKQSAVDDGEETDEETPKLVEDSPLSGRERRASSRRNGIRDGVADKRAVVMNGLNGHASPTVIVPSPSSLASLPCLSTSSSASTITSTSSSPVPLPGTPDSNGSEPGSRSSLQLLSPPSPRPMHSKDAGADGVDSGSRRVNTRRGNAIEYADDRKIALALERELNSWTSRSVKLTATPRKRAAGGSPAKGGEKVQVNGVGEEAHGDNGVNGGTVVDGGNEVGGASSEGRAGSKRLRMR